MEMDIIIEISDDEVICLDDDDDDNYHNHNDNNNNNNGNGNNLQGLENSINPLNCWILPPRVLLDTGSHIFLSTDETVDLFTDETVDLTTEEDNAPKKNPVIMPLSTSEEGSLLNQGEDMYIDVDNEPTEPLLVEPETEPPRVMPDTGSHIFLSTDETVDLTTEEDNTPKKNPVIMPLSTSEEGSLLNQGEDMYIDVDNEPTEPLLVEPETEPPRVMPDTGSHIFLSTDETVDLTTEEDNTPKKKQIIRQKKTPKTKKDVASKSGTSLTNPRPKRACAIDRVAERKKSGLCKLGKYIEGKDGSWVLRLVNISLPMFQCPICDVFLPSSESRNTHEVLKHSSLLESIHKSVDIVSNPENKICSQQSTLFNYLNLCVTSKYKTKVVHELAKRTHFLKSLKVMKIKPTDSFKCNYCPYESNLIIASWAHMTSNHLYLKCDAEKNSSSYCFVCNRTLTKRTTMMKHLDACINKLSELSVTDNGDNSRKRFKCQLCDEDFDSLKGLEAHIWGHAKKKK